MSLVGPTVKARECPPILRAVEATDYLGVDDRTAAVTAAMERGMLRLNK